MNLKKQEKFVCCSMDVTIGSRIIGFIGIMVSVLLMTVFLNDRYFDKNENYDVSRKTALALGLYWEHFHPEASAVDHKDPEGKMISIIVLFYATLFLVINFLLCFATIKNDWKCAIPWLVCELFGCLSKLGALIFHLNCDKEILDNIFITGSIIYIVIISWWWVIVFFALLSWRCKKSPVQKLELSKLSSTSKSQDTNITVLPGKVRFIQESTADSLIVDSPGPYTPNKFYALI